jgi:hypothetical protein
VFGNPAQVANGKISSSGGRITIQVASSQDIDFTIGDETTSVTGLKNSMASIRTAVSDAVDELSGQVDSTARDVSEQLRLGLSGLNISLTRDMTTATGRLDTLESRVSSAVGCEELGLLWNGTACNRVTPVVGLQLGRNCTNGNEGQLRYSPTRKNIEVCNGNEWVRAGKPQVGGSRSVPGISCEQIAGQGESEGTGWYYIGRLSNVELKLCGMELADFEVSFGDATDGDVTINGARVVMIEDIFSGYNPRTGNIPNWNNVVLSGGVQLTTRPYNAARDGYKGGIVAFKALGTVSICANCMINVTAKGFPGGVTQGRRTPRFTSERGNSGAGPGAGRGGCGGDCNGVSAHGAGGGGASFRTVGTVGTPDRMRQWGENSATPGAMYPPNSLFFSGDPSMGSGGGAGGLGHRGYPPQARPGSGGAGGGAIQISATRMNNLGTLEANGQRGGNQGYHGNPQTGSGGAGSGGLITLSVAGGSIGAALVKGGMKGWSQAWVAREAGPRTGPNVWDRVHTGQTGGEGGDGYVIVSNFPNISVTERCTAAECALGRVRNPARSCQALQDSGIRTNGRYFVGYPGRAAIWYCELDGGGNRAPSGYSWGDGRDGDVTITAPTNIKDLFKAYNPRVGLLPQWRNVVISGSNAQLLVDKYDGSGGGILAFSAHSLVIQNGGSIKVDGAGYRGGTDKYGRNYYPSNHRNSGGEGRGAGRGGRGGLSCCHGSGGGGGSFARAGGVGNPDLNRNSGDRTAVPGPTYNWRGTYYAATEQMGSGGGAGGGGHPGSSYCEGFPGSAGGGTMMIMARSFRNSGTLSARGQAGGPTSGYCQWPSGNPQSGSGGAGSGGGVKVMTAATVSQGRTVVEGGARPILQGWSSRNNQQGGAGGNGRASFAHSLTGIP